MKLTAILAATAAMLVATAPATATTAKFDFEGQPDTAFTGAYTTLSLTKNGIGVTLSRGGDTFDVNNGATVALPFIGAESFGTLSLSPFSEETASSPFLADFSTGLTSISIDAGDYGADSDVFTLSVYSSLGGTGTLLGTTSFDYGASSFPTITTLSIATATPFLSAVFVGGSADFPNSLYYDNITVSDGLAAVPEPATWALIIGGIGMVGGSLRRRAKVKAIVSFA